MKKIKIIIETPQGRIFTDVEIEEALIGKHLAPAITSAFSGVISPEVGGVIEKVIILQGEEEIFSNEFVLNQAGVAMIRLGRIFPFPEWQSM